MRSAPKARPVSGNLEKFESPLRGPEGAYCERRKAAGPYPWLLIEVLGNEKVSDH